MRLHACLLALVASLATVLVVAPVAPAAPPAATGAGLTAPVTGTATDPLTGVIGTLTGTFAITGFTVQNGQLAAVGTLTATVTDAAGHVIRTISQVVTIPLQTGGSCPILHLELGPLDLNLLGLVVHLNRVVLDITAQPGPGNLLGNLLCAVSHLLDGNAAGGALQNLLNELTAALGGL